MSSSQTSSSSTDTDVAPLAPMFDVSCAVDVLVGTGTITVREFLQLAPETVLRLEQAAGADLEVWVHGVQVAHGEVAVLEDMASLRLTRLAPPTGPGWE